MYRNPGLPPGEDVLVFREMLIMVPIKQRHRSERHTLFCILIYTFVGLAVHTIPGCGGGGRSSSGTLPARPGNDDNTLLQSADAEKDKDVPELSVANLDSLSEEELKVHLRSLSKIYHTKKKSYNLMKATNTLLCAEVVAFLKKCSVAHPLSSRFFEKHDCRHQTSPLPTIQYSVELQSTVNKTWKIIGTDNNTRIESSTFQASGPITFEKRLDENTTINTFSLLIRNLESLQVVSTQGPDAASDITSLSLVLNGTKLLTFNTFTAANNGITLDPAEIKAKASHSDCNPNIQQTLEEIDTKAKDILKKNE